MIDFADYQKNREFLVQSNGVSEVLHKMSNGAYVSRASVQSAFAILLHHMFQM